MSNLVMLEQKSKFIRKNVVDVAVKNGAGHIAPSLSCVDLLVALYYDLMKLPKSNSLEGFEDRDRLVFSKAHGCYGLYSILADCGYIPKEYWENFYSDSPLSGCVERNESFLIEAGCGSLGHGLPLAVGIAFGAQLQNKSYRTYCIVGDGEMQEGTSWEAAQFAAKHNLSNFVLIIDNNRIQAMDFTQNVLSSNDNELYNKLLAFGFEVATCNGHNLADILSAFGSFKTDSPKVVIADTIKGYGLKCMENVPMFHFRLPSAEELLMGNRYE